MDANSNQGHRAVYMNEKGQTVNPYTGKTVSNSDPVSRPRVRDGKASMSKPVFR